MTFFATHSYPAAIPVIISASVSVLEFIVRHFRMENVTFFNFHKLPQGLFLTAMFVALVLNVFWFNERQSALQRVVQLTLAI